MLPVVPAVCLLETGPLVCRGRGTKVVRPTLRTAFNVGNTSATRTALQRAVLSAMRTSRPHPRVTGNGNGKGERSLLPLPTILFTRVCTTHLLADCQAYLVHQPQLCGDHQAPQPIQPAAWWQPRWHPCVAVRWGCLCAPRTLLPAASTRAAARRPAAPRPASLAARQHGITHGSGARALAAQAHATGGDVAAE